MWRAKKEESPNWIRSVSNVLTYTPDYINKRICGKNVQIVLQFWHFESHPNHENEWKKILLFCVFFWKVVQSVFRIFLMAMVGMGIGYKC